MARIHSPLWGTPWDPGRKQVCNLPFKPVFRALFSFLSSQGSEMYRKGHAKVLCLHTGQCPWISSPTSALLPRAARHMAFPLMQAWGGLCTQANVSGVSRCLVAGRSEWLHIPALISLCSWPLHQAQVPESTKLHAGLGSRRQYPGSGSQRQMYPWKQRSVPASWR